jgi:hypothetical protein
MGEKTRNQIIGTISTGLLITGVVRLAMFLGEPWAGYIGLAIGVAIGGSVFAVLLTHILRKRRSKNAQDLMQKVYDKFLPH